MATKTVTSSLPSPRFDEWEEPTVVRFEVTPSCRREPVEERDGFEPPVAVAA